ncbi:MAG: NrdJb [Sulfuricella sp.]
MTTVLGRKIVKAEVPAERAAPLPVMPIPLVDRPPELVGTTYQIKTPLSEHALYVTITDHDGRPFEMFINSKAMEHFQWIVALTRIVSAVFRHAATHGGEVAFVAEELLAVFDPKGGYFRKGGRFMPSLVAEIGLVLETHLYARGLIVRDTSMMDAARALVAEKTGGQFPDHATLCAKCSIRAVVMLDGCAVCLNCSDSKCG